MAILDLVNILAGLVLAVGALSAVPGIGKSLEKAGKFLGGFQVIIGILAIVLGFLNFAGIKGWLAIIAGLVLLTGVLQMIPSLGKFVKKLGAFQTIIGIIVLIVGILGLLGMM